MLYDTDNNRNLILVIDDSVSIVRFLCELLKEQGQILFATNGADGLEIARARQPQLILLDVELPDMDGYEVCRQLKNQPETCDAAIMFVTGQTSMENEIRALEAGAVDFISKPMNPPVVCARVRTQLKLRQTLTTLAQLANRDGLTGLMNRRFGDEQLQDEVRRHQRQQLSLGMAFIDIDDFKAYNDHYGHQAGDDCLRAVARALGQSTRRPGEFVARYGGEEFLAVLPYSSHAEVEQYGEWIRNQIEAQQLPHPRSRVGGVVTISVGVASFVPLAEQTAADLVAAADAALYRAKAAGRNCVKS